jgi:hypothetical protein
MEQDTRDLKANMNANPVGDGLEIEVSIPKKIEIKMVNASNLNDYELWGVITSVFCNFLVGFLIATISNTVEERHTLLWSITAIFTSFVLFSGYMTYKKRKQMTIKEKMIKMNMIKK